LIEFDAAARTFALGGRASLYAMQVADDGRLEHLGWVAGDPASGAAAAAGRLPRSPLVGQGLDRQGRRDEVLGFGDHAYREVTLAVEFPALPDLRAAHDAAHAPIRDVRLRYAGHEIVADAEPGGAPHHGLPTRVTSSRQTLRVRLEDPAQPFAATACYRLTPEHDVIERWLELENRGAEPVRVAQCFFASLHLPAGRYELLHASGGWAAEFQSERVLVPVGTTALESRSVQTGFLHHPFFLLCPAGGASEDAGCVWFGQLAWSGAWRLELEQRPNGGFVVHGGYNPFDFELVLGPGERHATPALVLGCCADGFGGASRRMHAWVRERVLPQPARPPATRPVLYNSWEATYFGLSLEGQLRLAERAAALGVELFCVDDGWFGARRSDRAGLGDWFPSPEIFPQGLRPLADGVHALGMQFGLWVEPEMTNADSELYRKHPDWVLHFAGRPRTEERNQLILDLGRAEVVEYLEQCLVRLLAETAIDFLKWDMNRYATEPGSAAGRAIWRRHAEAVYGLMDRLRARFPALAIESCASGGGRVDAGILARTDQVWTSDNTDALSRVEIQDGFSLAYPAAVMTCWVTHERNHQTGRRLPLGLRFDVAMRGVLGIGSDLGALDDAELADYKRWIAFYKRIRHVVQQGDLYRLATSAECGTSLVEYVLPDASEAVVSCVALERRIGQAIAPARLRALDPHASYAAFDRDGAEIARAPGSEWMTLGLDANLVPGWHAPGWSRTLHLVRV
jgi:alpha-galactosidase